MRYFLVVCMLITVNVVRAQSANSFPRSWLGEWKGKLEWYRAGQQEPRTVEMQLLIKPVRDSVGLYTWNLIYGKPSEDNRPYYLRAVDTAKGHWVVDEVNGIFLDQYLIGNKLVGVFTVNNVVITNTYELVDDKLQIEFISHRKEPVRNSGKGTEESPAVAAFDVFSYQKGILKRTP